MPEGEAAGDRARLGPAVRRAVRPPRHRALLGEAQLLRGVPQADVEGVGEGVSASPGASSRASTTSGVSPSSHPVRLSGRGLAPLSGWRPTFRPSSSKSARSSAGVEPSVVRKFPIITPLSPALTASPWRAPRFSTRPPQRRKSAAGRIRRKIAIHFTASHGSRWSRSPNFVPGRGLRRLIGTDVGSTVASSKAISTRCSSDSPRLRMPPTQVSSPASLTAWIVRTRPS